MDNSQNSSQGYNQTDYTQQGYDPNAYYQQSGYTQQGYDPSAYYQQSGYTQQGYDPNAYYQQGGYAQQGYDPNAYYQQGGYMQQVSNDPNNPMRLTVSPTNPSTSSNNITLNLDTLYERLNNEIKKNQAQVNPFEEIKNFLLYLVQSTAQIEVYSILTDSESILAQGIINTVNNNTISIDSKVVALKYISYIKFNSENIDDRSINGFFYQNMIRNSQNIAPMNIEAPKNDFYNYILSRRNFNQYVNLVIESTFLISIEKLIVIDINEAIAVFRDEEHYYMIPLEKIITME